MPKMVGKKVSLGRMTYDKAMSEIIAAAKNVEPDDPMRFAAVYADAARQFDKDEHRRNQTMYILANLTHWKGEKAVKVRTFLRNYAAQK